ncbi:CaiB/BaiF CoA transferase family protein [Prauserella cavernicola]|uniref:CoA transferase n=1 Tax=Prauserella cavernicola TaxID=2800127 RepID=A0A934QWS8_9PSEU|nr:CoA transferase [Prauserella cavernicola]MBK1787805.1 CoA transferase [Prauserella cavernicola]
MVVPLRDVRVVELCTVASGPYCGMLLADLGADVVKVESPAGDTMRQWPPITDGFSDNFASLNRNKRSVALDLKDPEDNATARRLIAEADVVIENSRPGVMAKLGLDYATVSADQPGLVYASISAFGQEGPRSREGGFDLTIQAMSGIISVTGEPGGAPVKCGVPISDFATGLYAAFAVAAALREVEHTGQGTHIDVSMLGSSLAIAALQVSEYFGKGTDPGKLGSAHPRNAPYQVFAAADGHVAMAAGNDKLWRALCGALDRDDLAADPRFSSTTTRAQHQDELRELLETQFAGHSAAELITLFEDAGVPCAPVNSYSEALADSQVEHMGWVSDLDLPGGRVTRTFGSPLRFGGEAPEIRRRPPSLGEHNAEVVAELGEA